MYMIPRGGCLSLLPSLLTNWAENIFQYKFFQPTSVRLALELRSMGLGGMMLLGEKTHSASG